MSRFYVAERPAPVIFRWLDGWMLAAMDCYQHGADPVGDFERLWPIVQEEIFAEVTRRASMQIRGAKDSNIEGAIHLCEPNPLP